MAPNHARSLDGRFDPWPWLILAACAALLLCSTCQQAPAQTVRLENLGGAHAGWIRTTVDKPIADAGRVGSTTFVAGRQVGLDTRVVDLRVTLDAGATRSIDLAASADVVFVRGPAPTDVPRLMGVPMAHLSTIPDGAGYLSHYRARQGPMFVVDLWVVRYPDEPGWCRGEAMVTASNPAVPDMSATVPAGFGLWFPGASTVLPGRGVDVALVAAGTVFGDGQARALPVVFCWPNRMREQDWPALQAAAHLAVGAVGINKLLADGNPVYPTGFSARGWWLPKFGAALARVHSWEGGVCGPPPNSPQAGEHEDSTFKRGEALLPGGAPAVTVAYLSALLMAKRPCHHLELDGSVLNPALHTTRPLIFWNSRPHEQLWGLVDRLGKPTPLGGEAAANGWWGADVEHAMFNTLAAAARMTGSPALQRLLRQQAVQYPLQWTTTPGWSNSQPFAARAVGWESLLAVHLWRELEDRQLAQRVRDHYVQRANLVLIPKLGTPPHPQWTAADGVYPSNVWDARKDDPRLGAGWWWMPWQQALGAYGADLAGAQFGLPALRAKALAAARKVLADAWVSGGADFDGTPDDVRRYWTYTGKVLLGLSDEDAAKFVPESAATDAPPQFTSRAYMPLVGGGIHNSDFNPYAMPLAAIVVLRHRANATPAEIAKAEGIIAQVKGSATLPKHTAWIAPPGSW